VSGSSPRPAGSPASAEDWFHHGVQLLGAGEVAAAEVAFAQAAALDGQLAEAHANLGYLLDLRGARTEAEASYRRALALQPDGVETLLNLGGLLMQGKQLDEAETLYRRALTLQPDNAQVCSNLGALYACVHRDAEAEACCRRAIALAPDRPKARFNLSYLLLRQGRYEEGWACFEARDWYAALQRQLQLPRWQGEPLAGKSILLGYEAGHGDMIQFCRYAQVLKAMGAARITLLCHPALKRLLAGMAALDEVRAFDEPQAVDGHWDLWTPLMSCPHHCQTRLDTLPAAIPYLSAPAAQAQRWVREMPRQGAGLRVGLAWKGNPKFDNDADRSLADLTVLAPLWQVPGVCFVSLQKGAGEDQARRPPVGQPLLEMGSQAQDFADMAGMLMNLDLVISVDTAVAHLAGALGVRCWLLLPAYQTDWRWLDGRADSPWYPGVMRLFRQRDMGDWVPVVDQVATELAALAVT
jgi:Flp pilus assembly protein TadD